MEPSTLATFWAGVLACAILLYVVLDGFDLGVGVLFGTTRGEAHRGRMMDTMAPFWDGNETWLVVIGAGLFAAFPDVYSSSTAAWWSCPSSPPTRSASTGSFAARSAKATVEGPAEGSRQARRRKQCLTRNC
jgi:hypothetical protein